MDTDKLKSVARIEIIVHPEEMPIEGNASALGDEEDTRIANDIRRQLECGNDYAWCTIEVRVSYGGITGRDFLGCCSYASEEEFKKDVYYADMLNSAFNDWVDQAVDIFQAVSAL